MIFYGKSIGTKSKFEVAFIKELCPALHRKGVVIKEIPSYYLIIYFGYSRFWIGWNRFKRIIKDELYELDGVKYWTEEYKP